MSRFYFCFIPLCTVGSSDDDDNNNNTSGESYLTRLSRLIWTPALTATEQLSEWRTQVRRERRTTDRAVREVTRRQVSVKNQILAAERTNKQNQLEPLKKELEGLEKAKSRIVVAFTKLGNLDMELRRQTAQARLYKSLSHSVEVMSLLSGMMKIPELRDLTRQMSQSMLKANLIDDVIDEALEGEEDKTDTSKAASATERLAEEHIESVIKDIYSGVANAPVEDGPIGEDVELENEFRNLGNSVKETATEKKPSGQMEK